MDFTRKALGVKQVASVNEFLLQGPWTKRDGRRALPLPVRLPFRAPRGTFLRSFVDRGQGWQQYDLDHVPEEIPGSGWWGDPVLYAKLAPEAILARVWAKIRMGDWKPQKRRAEPPLPPARRLERYPLVSLVIPTDGRVVTGLKGPIDLIENCYRSIVTRSTYPNLEILIAHNGRISPGIPALRYEDPGPFNLARKLNFLIKQARGEYVVILNDDTEVIEPSWVEALLEYALIPEVGAVGARLHYPDGRIQHAGVVFGRSTLCGHVFAGHAYDCPSAARPRECSAVTGACMMFRRDLSLDESFQGIFDVDFCLKRRAEGQKIIYAPRARLFHYESASLATVERRLFREKVLLKQRWPGCLPDPFFLSDECPCLADR